MLGHDAGGVCFPVVAGTASCGQQSLLLSITFTAVGHRALSVREADYLAIRLLKKTSWLSVSL